MCWPEGHERGQSLAGLALGNVLKPPPQAHKGEQHNGRLKEIGGAAFALYLIKRMGGGAYGRWVVMFLGSMQVDVGGEGGVGGF